MPVLIGYARVSTPDEIDALAAQEAALFQAGCEEAFWDTCVRARPALGRCLAYVESGDVLVATDLGRLARSVTEVVAVAHDLAARGVRLLVLDVGGGVLDTRTAAGQRLLAVLGSVATWQHDAAVEGQREGIKGAQDAGRYRGRVRSVDSAEVAALAPRVGVGQIAAHLGVSRTSVYRALAEARAREAATSGEPAG